MKLEKFGKWVGTKSICKKMNFVLKAECRKSPVIWPPQSSTDKKFFSPVLRWRHSRPAGRPLPVVPDELNTLKLKLIQIIQSGCGSYRQPWITSLSSGSWNCILSTRFSLLKDRGFTCWGLFRWVFWSLELLQDRTRELKSNEFELGTVTGFC